MDNWTKNIDSSVRNQTDVSYLDFNIFDTATVAFYSNYQVVIYLVRLINGVGVPLLGQSTSGIVNKAMSGQW